MRKHSCFTNVWCHHKTAPPMLIFNKDQTFISHLQTVREKHKVEINSVDCFPLRLKFYLFIFYFFTRSLANNWWRNFCPYRTAVSGCYCKCKMYMIDSCNLTHQSGVTPERHQVALPEVTSRQTQLSLTEAEPDPQRPVYFLCSGASDGSVPLSALSYLLK